MSKSIMKKTFESIMMSKTFEFIVSRSIMDLFWSVFCCVAFVSGMFVGSYKFSPGMTIPEVIYESCYSIIVGMWLLTTISLLKYYDSNKKIDEETKKYETELDGVYRDLLLVNPNIELAKMTVEDA